MNYKITLQNRNETNLSLEYLTKESPMMFKIRINKVLDDKGSLTDLFANMHRDGELMFDFELLYYNDTTLIYEFERCVGNMYLTIEKVK